MAAISASFGLRLAPALRGTARRGAASRAVSTTVRAAVGKEVGLRVGTFHSPWDYFAIQTPIDW